MKNQEVWSHYKDYTKDMNDFSRKLAFGGLAVCWLPKSKTSLTCYVAEYLIQEVSN
jgi:hypothetical protein